MDQPLAEVTQLLKAWSEGDEHALAELTPQVYVELRRTADKYIRNEKTGQTLQQQRWFTRCFCAWLR